MPKLSGFELLKTLQNPPHVIVTSAHKEFALEGFDLNVSDYLLKPFTFERFMRAVNKAIYIQTSNESSSSTDRKGLRFFLKGDKKHHQIFSEDILFIEAYGNYSKVYIIDEMIVSHEKISSLEKILSNEKFLRVHKSFIVSLDKIKLIEGNQISINKHLIPIGQTYKNDLKRFLYND